MVIRLDPATGSVSQAFVLPADMSVASGEGEAIADGDRQLLYVLTATNGAPMQHIATIDYAAGKVVSEALIPAQLHELGIEASTGNLFGHSRDPTSDGTSIVRVDPANGEVTPFSTYPLPSSSGPLGNDAFDGVRTYFTVDPFDDSADPSFALHEQDVPTGGIITIPIDARRLDNLAYDGVLHQLVSISYADGIGVVTIDPATGATTSKIDIAGLDHAFATARAIDPTTHRYFFVGGSNFPEGGSAWTSKNRIFTVDEQTGTIGAEAIIAWSQAIYCLQYVP